MKIKKQVVTQLTKCYSLAEIDRNGTKSYLVASEKQFPCILLNDRWEVVDTVWDGPGGVMTLEPLENGNGAFLATHRFYSPNDSANASIVLAQPSERGWTVRPLCKLPYVHRFGLVRRDSRTYLVAATLKSDHQFKDDWTCPGRVWVGELPEDLSVVDEARPLTLTPLISGLLRNHGFFKYEENGHGVCLVGTENGIYKIVPPAADGQWSAEKLLDVSASDMLLADFDGDGQKELLVLSPFHGEKLSVYKAVDGMYQEVYQAPNMPFLHALAPCTLGGKEVAVIGHRQGNRDLVMISRDGSGYRCDVLDHDIGPANVLCRADGDGMWILSANREIDEVAVYHVTAEQEARQC